jgi:hypothetical protein
MAPQHFGEWRPEERSSMFFSAFCRLSTIFLNVIMSRVILVYVILLNAIF